MLQNSIQNPLLVALGGPTGSGKTALAIKLAKKHPELVILSADSRQIYERLDIGSAKVGTPSTESSLTGKPEPVCVYDDVPQFLVGIAQTNHTMSLTEYQTEAERLIRACWQANRVPLLVGGTGLYIEALFKGFRPAGEPDSQAREALLKLGVEQLQRLAKQKNITLNHSDWNNPRRLIRAIERLEGESHNEPLTTNTHLFVLNKDWEEQRNLALAMVQERLDLGVVAETKELLSSGVDKTWLKETGLSYRQVIRMLDGEIDEAQLFETLVKEFQQLMRRQRSWFKHMQPQISGDATKISSEITKPLT